MKCPIKVFYNSLGTEPMYEIIREVVPAGFELETLVSESDEERKKLIAPCEVAIVAATPLTGAIIENATSLRLVHHQGVGYHDTVDYEMLARRGIRLALTPVGTTLSVAEHTLLLTLAACRRLPFADNELRHGRWHVNSLRPYSLELSGRTVGYIGMGRIGREAARLFRAFRTSGLYYDPYTVLSEVQERELGLERVDLERLLTQADVVSLHIPATPETRHLINAETLAHMKRTAVLVNTARGSIVDEGALYEALSCGRIGAAGLDVFESEPLTTESPLVTLPNAVLTPHISAGTRDALTQKMNALFENIVRFFDSGHLEHEVMLGNTASA